MLPCKEIVRILSSQDEIPLMKKAELKMHLLMCKHCSRYAAHLKMMTDGFKKLFAKMTSVEKSEVTQLEADVLKKLKQKP